jgi:hypothetical protein
VQLPPTTASLQVGDGQAQRSKNPPVRVQVVEGKTLESLNLKTFL